MPNNIDDMVECEECHLWHHYGCAGFDEGRVDENWKCTKCVTRLAASENATDPLAGPTNDQPNVAAASGSDLVDERARRNLKLLEEQKLYLVKEIELEHKQQLERKVMLLEKEAWKARFDILNAGGDDNNGTQCLTDWSKRLNEIAASPNQQPPTSSGSVTFARISSDPRQPILAAVLCSNQCCVNGTSKLVVSNSLASKAGECLFRLPVGTSDAKCCANGTRKAVIINSHPSNAGKCFFRLPGGTSVVKWCRHRASFEFHTRVPSSRGSKPSRIVDTDNHGILGESCAMFYQFYAMPTTFN